MPFTSSEEEEFTGKDEEEEEESEAAADDDDDEEESSDDEPLSALKAKPTRKRSPVKASLKDESTEEEEEEEEEEEMEEDDSDDSDDDVPLSSLAKKPTPKKKAKAKPVAKKKKAAPKKKATKKKAAAPSSSSSGSNKKYEWASAALYGTDCDKGLLIQRLLCRWWYAYDWPSNVPDKPPKNYDALEGFPGVYICTDGEDVGTIKDERDPDSAPSFNNFAKKSSDELRDLLVKAISAQKQALVAAEGTGTATEKELNDLLKWANKLNVSKAEKEAAKVLKSQGMSLP